MISFRQQQSWSNEWDAPSPSSSSSSSQFTSDYDDNGSDSSCDDDDDDDNNEEEESYGDDDHKDSHNDISDSSRDCTGENGEADDSENDDDDENSDRQSLLPRYVIEGQAVSHALQTAASVWTTVRRRARVGGDVGYRLNAEEDRIHQFTASDKKHSFNRTPLHRKTIKRRMKITRGNFLWGQWKSRWIPLCGCVSTYILLTSSILWLTLVCLSFPLDPTNDSYRLRRRSPRHRRNYSHGDFLLHNVAKSVSQLWTGSKHVDVEELQAGCDRAEWQERSFPTCNDIHEIDLRSSVVRAEKGYNGTLGYLTSGLWRSVWAVDPRAVMNEPIILKMMKQQHEVDLRNFDRHRRDALVMERLSSSSYVVDIYGFCGNSVLTEYLATSLNEIIRNPFDDNSTITRKTPEGRLKLAIDMAKGLQALHEVPGGPILHADITASQFLVSSSSGRLKVNDFNRCRFMAHDNKTGLPCKLRIPSAPGSSRSPEEYASEELDEKIDVYSMANIYFELLTGKWPWSGYLSSEVQSFVMKGKKPSVPEEYLVSPSDYYLANATMLAYEKDSSKRPSAAEIVQLLQDLSPAVN